MISPAKKGSALYASRALIGRVEPGMWGPPEAYEWLRIVPEGIGLIITVSGLQNLSPEEMAKARANIADCVQKLDMEGADVIDVGGSPVLGYTGYDAYREFLTSLRNLTSVPLVTALTAEFDALKKLGMKRLVVVTPYQDGLNRNRRELLENNGFEVLNIKGVGLRAMRDINRLPEDASYKLAKEAYTECPQADGIYIACPAWPVVGNIARLEDELGKPVVTNVQAQVWACLTAIGMNEPIHGYGKLLATMP